MLNNIDFSKSSPTLLRIFISKHNQAPQKIQEDPIIAELYNIAFGIVLAQDQNPQELIYTTKKAKAIPVSDYERKVNDTWIQAIKTIEEYA